MKEDPREMQTKHPVYPAHHQDPDPARGGHSDPAPTETWVRPPVGVSLAGGTAGVQCILDGRGRGTLTPSGGNLHHLCRW